MNEALRDAVARYAEDHADDDGTARTPLPGLTAIRSTARSELVYAISRPLVGLVLQGRKEVAMGAEHLSCGAGDSLLVTADVPTVSRITRASIAAPYLSLVIDLDVSVIAELAVDADGGRDDGLPPVRAGTTDAEVADAALRLMRLLERPAPLAALQAQTVRELHYWLLAGRHGPAIRRLGGAQGNAQRIARAVALLRADYAGPLPVGRLAAAAGMSASTFHHHFRAVTSLSPLQFQKQLRLIEARRRMVAEGASASSAAFAVGYESASQFTRDYGRMFGAPPLRDASALRRRAGSATRAGAAAV